MKFYLVALSLTLVGSCATLRHTEKIEHLKESIIFEDSKTIDIYLNTINEEELKEHVYAFSADEFQGRMAGEPGHHKASKFIKDYYIKKTNCIGFLYCCLSLEMNKVISPDTNAAIAGINAILNSGVTARISAKIAVMKPKIKYNFFI